jgi:hypothetical protein
LFCSQLNEDRKVGNFLDCDWLASSYHIHILRERFPCVHHCQSDTEWFSRFWFSFDGADAHPSSLIEPRIAFDLLNTPFSRLSSTGGCIRRFPHFMELAPINPKRKNTDRNKNHSSHGLNHSSHGLPPLRVSPPMRFARLVLFIVNWPAAIFATRQDRLRRIAACVCARVLIALIGNHLLFPMLVPRRGRLNAFTAYELRISQSLADAFVMFEQL